MSPLLKPQKRRPPISGCQINDIEGERQENTWRGSQLDVENIVMVPSSSPLARTFPSGENSKAATDSFSPVMVVSCSYRRIGKGVKDGVLTVFTRVSHAIRVYRQAGQYIRSTVQPSRW